MLQINRCRKTAAPFAERLSRPIFCCALLVVAFHSAFAQAAFVQADESSPSESAQLESAADLDASPESPHTPAAMPAREQLPLGAGVQEGSNTRDQSAGRSTGNNSFGEMLMQTLGALGLVIAAVFGARALLLKWRGDLPVAAAGQTADPDAQLVLVDQLSLGPQRRVMLIRVAGRLLVVGDSPAGLQTLSTFSADESTQQLKSQPTTDFPEVEAVDAQQPQQTKRIEEDEPAASQPMTAADIDSLLAGLRERREASAQEVSR